jgi:lipoyl(octanoyl) transferase
MPSHMSMPHPFEPGPEWLQIRDLGRVGYADALHLQRSLQQEVQDTRATGCPRGHLLLLEHAPPVVTVSRRPGAGANVLVGADVLARHGVERHETDRGGDVTYHGPGQLVAYPIVDLDVVGVRIHGWIRLLEQSIIDTLAELGIQAGRDPGATGVWVGRDPGTPDGFGGRKIAAIGVRVSRWVTMHGLALNVDPDLSHFDLIVPCGLAGRPVTSIAKELGTAPEMAEVKRRLAANVSSNLQAPPV